MNTKIEQYISEIEPWLIHTRRDIHAHPELGERENRTSEVVARELTGFGINIFRNVAKTGVIGVLEGSRPGPVVLWRADMDALPIEEKTGLPFASKVKDLWRGEETFISHMCGHDVHTAVALGAAKVLAQFRESISGKVVFLFQPAEEGTEGPDPRGAERVVKEGWLDRLGPVAAFALHCFPDLNIGQLGYTPGGALAAVDMFKITVKGKKTHGAYPQDGVDPVSIAAKIVSSLEMIPSREVDARDAVVITVGSIHGGNRFNIVPDIIEMVGTIRTHENEIQEFVHKRIKEMVTGIAHAFRGEADVKITKEGPITWNDPLLCEKTLPSLFAVVGKDNVVKVKGSMGAEDFAFIANKIPSLFFRLGVKGAVQTGPFHSDNFNPDERSLVIGVKAAVNILLDFPGVQAL